jgi:hypothetical protein
MVPLTTGYARDHARGKVSREQCQIAVSSDGMDAPEADGSISPRILSLWAAALVIVLSIFRVPKTTAYARDRIRGKMSREKYQIAVSSDGMDNPEAEVLRTAHIVVVGGCACNHSFNSHLKCELMLLILNVRLECRASTSTRLHLGTSRLAIYTSDVLHMNMFLLLCFGFRDPLVTLALLFPLPLSLPVLMLFLL